VFNGLGDLFNRLSNPTVTEFVQVWIQYEQTRSNPSCLEVYEFVRLVNTPTHNVIVKNV